MKFGDVYRDENDGETVMLLRRRDIDVGEDGEMWEAMRLAWPQYEGEDGVTGRTTILIIGGKPGQFGNWRPAEKPDDPE